MPPLGGTFSALIFSLLHTNVVHCTMLEHGKWRYLCHLFSTGLYIFWTYFTLGKQKMTTQHCISSKSTRLIERKGRESNMKVLAGEIEMHEKVNSMTSSTASASGNSSKMSNNDQAPLAVKSRDSMKNTRPGSSSKTLTN